MLEAEFASPRSRTGAALSFQLPRLWWLNTSLFLTTLLTTTAFGSAVVHGFRAGRPLSLEDVVSGYERLLYLRPGLWEGLEFSLPLLTILLAHELGHFLECRRRKVDASWPYFLPSPSLFGTVGAFIRIRSPIYTRTALFDIGIGGPIAGFAVLLPLLVAGVALSKVTAGPPSSDALVFGSPLALQLMIKVFLPGLGPGQVVLHPLALAAWAGLFATALNLIPIGQLDGGHIVYALAGARWHRIVSLTFIALLLLAGFLYWPWWVWGTLMFFFKRHHPLVYDRAPLPQSRFLLSVLALAMLLLSAAVVPVRTL